MTLAHISSRDVRQYVDDVAEFLPFLVRELGGKAVTGEVTLSLEVDGDRHAPKLVLTFERSLSQTTQQRAITTLLSKIPDSELTPEDFHVVC